ncbi:MAG: hypothetical protein HYT78_08290 [Deltaproteobacteria bacterium]|nr:hypothetical protein [Deltaproteobacteria bacterium]
MNVREGYERSVDLALIQNLIRGEQGAWEEFVHRYSDLIYSLCSLAFSNRELEAEYLNVVRLLRADDFSVLRAFNGRASLSTFLTIKIRDLLAGRILELFKEDTDRAWRAFERFFEKEFKAVARESQDLLQDIRVLLIEDGFRRILSYAGRGSFTGYILTTIHNLCLDLRRKSKGRRRLPEAVLQLPPLEQEVYRQIYWNACSEKYLSEVLRDESGNRYPQSRIEQALAQVREAVSGRKRQLSPSGRPGMEYSLGLEDGQGGGKEWEVPDFTYCPETVLFAAEDERSLEKGFSVLKQVVDELPAELGLYVRLRFYTNPPMSPQDIAHLMRRSDREIYRIRQEAISYLRTALKARGIGKTQYLSV